MHACVMYQQSFIMGAHKSVIVPDSLCWPTLCFFKANHINIPSLWILGLSFEILIFHLKGKYQVCSSTAKFLASSSYSHLLLYLLHTLDIVL